MSGHIERSPNKKGAPLLLDSLCFCRKALSLYMYIYIYVYIHKKYFVELLARAGWGLACLHISIHSPQPVSDVLCLANGIAGVVEGIMFGEQTTYCFWLKKLQRLKYWNWGRVWQLLGSHLLTPALTESWALPPWWRWDDDVLDDVLTTLLKTRNSTLTHKPLCRCCI